MGDDKSIVDAHKLVRINVNGSELELQATNGIFATTCSVVIPEAEDALIFVSASKFVEAVDKLGEEFDLSITSGKLKLSSGKQKITLSGSDDVPEFPLIPQFPFNNYFEVGAESFLDKINSVLPCVDPNSGNMTFRCISFKCDGNSLRMMGAENTMAAINEISLSKSVPEFSILILAPFFKELKLVKTPTFKIGVDGSRMHLWAGDVMIQSITVTNKVLKIDHLFIPKEDAFQFSFNANEALEAVEIANIFAASNTDRPYFCRLESDNGQIQVVADSQDGTSDVKFAYEGEFKGKHGININSLIKALDAGFDDITCRLQETSKSPFIFLSKSDPSWAMMIGSMDVK